MYTRNSSKKEQSNKENSADEQAKINYMNRKKQYEKEKIGEGKKKTQGYFKNSVYKTSINLTHRKAVSYFKN